jgi:hypothetical protein
MTGRQYAPMAVNISLRREIVYKSWLANQDKIALRIGLVASECIAYNCFFSLKLRKHWFKSEAVSVSLD